MMVPNETALAAGFSPVRADEVRPGQNVWCGRGDYRRAEPRVRRDGFIVMCNGAYHPAARVYVR